MAPRGRQRRAVMLMVVLMIIGGLSCAAAARPRFTAQHARRLAENIRTNSFDSSEPLRQERARSVTGRIDRAVVAGGGTAAVRAATTTRPGDDLNRRRLAAAQDKVLDINGFDTTDPLRQGRSQSMMGHIQRAAAAGGARDTTGHATAAATRDGRDEAYGPLDRRRLAQDFGNTMNDVLRSEGRQSRVAGVTAAIRDAAAGRTPTRAASKLGTAAPDVPAVLPNAERLAGPAAAGRQAP